MQTRRRRNIIRRLGFKCHLCGAKLTEEECTLDHIIPISRGGACSTTSNVKVACYACNQDRGVQDVSLYRMLKLMKQRYPMIIGGSALLLNKCGNWDFYRQCMLVGRTWSAKNIRKKL